jgi:hypothetical protein
VSSNKKNRPLARRTGPAQYTQITEPNLPASGDAPPSDDVARYIADMTIQLASMASGAKLELLAYFLNMAHAESVAIARQPPIVVDPLD